MRALMTIVALLLAVSATATDRKTCIDKAWKFHYGAVNGAYAVNYDDASWRTLDLPHDWSVETEAAEAAGDNVGPFTKNNPGGTSLGYQTAQTVGGEAWYRKTFTLSKEDLQGRVELYFEGAYNHSEVYLNGKKLYFNPYGYMSFRFDITDACNKANEVNTLAVRVTNEGVNTRWYAGSGIYRHVWLIRKPKLNLSEWDTFVRTQSVDGTTAKVRLSAKVFNKSDKDEDASLDIKVMSPEGAEVAHATAKTAVDAFGEAQQAVDLTVAGAELWSPETPRIYHAVLTLTGKNATTDVLDIPFGIRSISYNATEGFLLNGKSVKLRGGCVHHDHGLLGSASYDKAEERKVSLLKQYGFNAVRCSHNIPSEHFLQACDSIGLMVLDECFDQWLVAKNTDDYHNWFQDYSDRDIQIMVRRDRNHPSIMFWSLGNEIPGRIEDSGMAAARRLRADILALDDTRPITAAIPEWDSPSHSWADETAKAFQSLDIGGYNYMYYNYEPDHEKYPDRLMMGLESYPKRASENWTLVEKHPYIIGDFTWTAMDYIGEAGIGHSEIVDNGKGTGFARPWPWFNGWCGDIDLIGCKKPQSYYRDVVWGIQPITMAVEAPIPSGKTEAISLWGWQDELQSWTWSGYSEKDQMTVNVYSRAPQVRLYLNGDSIGTKSTSSTFWAGFSVPYKTGTLRAVEVRDGVEGASFELKTTSDPVAIRLSADVDTLLRTGTDLAYVIVELVDKDGQVVNDSERKVAFTVTGNATLLAGGNASPTDQESFRSSTPRLFRGRALAIVKGGENAGKAVLTVTSDGLETQTQDFTVTDNATTTGIGRTVYTGGNVTAYGKDGHVHVIGTSNYRLFSTDGAEIDKKATLPAGVYIVKTASRSMKVSVK